MQLGGGIHFAISCMNFMHEIAAVKSLMSAEQVPFSIAVTPLLVEVTCRASPSGRRKRSPNVLWRCVHGNSFAVHAAPASLDHSDYVVTQRGLVTSWP